MCVRFESRKSRDLDALGSEEVMVVMKVGIVVTVPVVVSELVSECKLRESEGESGKDSASVRENEWEEREMEWKWENE